MNYDPATPPPSGLPVYSEVIMAEWKESKHPRVPSGSEDGGQFTIVPKGVRLGTVGPGARVVGGFSSKHMGGGDGYRENNYGIGVISSKGTVVGIYQNSMDKPSIYFGKEFKRKLVGSDSVNLSAGVVVGAVTGYVKPFTPMLLPELIQKIGDTEVALTYVPKVKGASPRESTPPVLAIQLRRKF